MIARIASGSTQYFLSDRLSVRLSLDSNGNVLGRQGHLPFGEDFAESGSQEKHDFTNYERDMESSTDYAINRQYSQIIGRFMRVDRIAGSNTTPQTHNRYTYGQSDPVNRIDREGLMAESPDGVPDLDSPIPAIEAMAPFVVPYTIESEDHAWSTQAFAPPAIFPATAAQTITVKAVIVNPFVTFLKNVDFYGDVVLSGRFLYSARKTVLFFINRTMVQKPISPADFPSGLVSHCALHARLVRGGICYPLRHNPINSIRIQWYLF